MQTPAHDNSSFISNLSSASSVKSVDSPASTPVVSFRRMPAVDSPEQSPGREVELSTRCYTGPGGKLKLPLPAELLISPSPCAWMLHSRTLEGHRRGHLPEDLSGMGLLLTVSRSTLGGAVDCWGGRERGKCLCQVM